MTDVDLALRGSEPAASDGDALPPPRSPAQLFWSQMKHSPLALAGGVLLALFYLLALLASFVAPYAPDAMDRSRFYHPPHAVHVRDAAGGFRRPFVRGTVLADPADFDYREQ